jgi:hypothetical protein
MKKLFSFALPTLLIAFGVTASATSLTITGTVLSAGVDNTGGTGGEFSGALNGNSINVYCVDFSDAFGFNTVYDNTAPHNLTISSGTSVASTLLGSNTTWHDTLGGSYNGQARYAMAAYLTTQYAAPSSAANDAIQLAIWDMLDVSTSLNNYNAAALADVNAAKTWFASLSAANLTAFENRISIYTDSNQKMQEFISVGPSTATPEPSSAALLGLGGSLIGLGSLRRRKKAAKN